MSEKYSYYKNQVGMSSDEALERELGILKSADDLDIFHIFVQQEVSEKINIILNEIERRKLKNND